MVRAMSESGATQGNGVTLRERILAWVATLVLVLLTVGMTLGNLVDWAAAWPFRKLSAEVAPVAQLLPAWTLFAPQPPTSTLDVLVRYSCDTGLRGFRTRSFLDLSAFQRAALKPRGPFGNRTEDVLTALTTQVADKAPGQDALKAFHAGDPEFHRLTARGKQAIIRAEQRLASASYRHALARYLFFAVARLGCRGRLPNTLQYAIESQGYGVGLASAGRTPSLVCMTGDLERNSVFVPSTQMRKLTVDSYMPWSCIRISSHESGLIEPRS